MVLCLNTSESLPALQGHPALAARAVRPAQQASALAPRSPPPSPSPPSRLRQLSCRQLLPCSGQSAAAHRRCSLRVRPGAPLALRVRVEQRRGPAQREEDLAGPRGQRSAERRRRRRRRRRLAALAQLRQRHRMQMAWHMPPAAAMTCRARLAQPLHRCRPQTAWSVHTPQAAACWMQHGKRHIIWMQLVLLRRRARRSQTALLRRKPMGRTRLRWPTPGLLSGCALQERCLPV